MKHYLIAIGLLSFCNAWGQSSQNSAFIGKATELLIGKQIVASTKDASLQKYGYRGFFQNYDSTATFIFPHALTYDSLVGDTFTVVRINMVPYNATESLSNSQRVLILDSKDWGRMYYLYDTKHEYNLEITTVGKVSFPEGYFCSEIIKNKDKFTDETYWVTPYLEPIHFERVRSTNGAIKYYIYLTARNTSVSGGSGIVILLEDGVKIQKPSAKVSITVDSDAKYVANSHFLLTESDIQKLTSSAITDIRLYIYDRSISEGNRYSDLLKCLRRAE